MTATLTRARKYVDQGSTWALLNELHSILGANGTIWPFWELTGQLIVGSITNAVPQLAGVGTDISSWTPRPLNLSSLNAYRNLTSNAHLTAGDDNNYSFGNATLDTPFTLGMWIAPSDITSVALMAKYNAAGTAREWAWRIGSASKMTLELYDESADTTEIATANTALSMNQMVFVAVTYDGGETSPVINFYVNGVQDGGDGSSVETGAYVAMENTATPLLIGASGTSAAITEQFTGWLALPFLSQSALTAAQIQSIYDITSQMVGI